MKKQILLINGCLGAVVFVSVIATAQNNTRPPNAQPSTPNAGVGQNTTNGVGTNTSGNTGIGTSGAPGNVRQNGTINPNGTIRDNRNGQLNSTGTSTVGPNTLQNPATAGQNSAITGTGTTSPATTLRPGINSPTGMGQTGVGTTSPGRGR